MHIIVFEGGGLIVLKQYTNKFLKCTSRVDQMSQKLLSDEEELFLVDATNKTIETLYGDLNSLLESLSK